MADNDWACAYRADRRTIAAAVVVHAALAVLGAVCGFAFIRWLIARLAGGGL